MCPLSSLHWDSIRRTSRHTVVLVFLILAALFALPSLVIAVLLWWRVGKTWDARERWSGIWVLAIIGVVVYAVICWRAYSLPTLLSHIFIELSHRSLPPVAHALVRVWVLHLLLAPGCTLILEGLHPFSRRRQLSLSTNVFSPSMTKRTTQQLIIASPSSSHAPALPLEPFGEFLGGDLTEWVCGNQLCIPYQELMRHIVVLGEPGYGKTSTLLRLALIAVRYGMQVIYLDLKGSPRTAALFVALMQLLGTERIKIFPQESYDGWRGDTQTLYNRLMQMVDPGTHPFYRKLTSALVALAVNAPGGPPVNSQDFLRRLDKNWLYRAYAEKTAEHAAARRKVAKLVPHMEDVSLTFEGFFDAIAGSLDGAWAFEDGDAVYMGLDGDSQKEHAALMGNYLLEDCAHYAKQRKGARHTLTIIDEFGVLESANAADLFERVREPGMSVCASAQSYESLGPQRKQIVTAASIKIVHRCGDPEALVKYAGQREVPTLSYLLEENEQESEQADLQATGEKPGQQRHTSVRMQKQYAMPIEEVQQLPQGRVALITGGLGAWCQVSPLVIPENLLRSVLPFVTTPPREMPLPSPPPKSTSGLAAQPLDPLSQEQQGGRTRRRGNSKKHAQETPSSIAPPVASASPSSTAADPAPGPSATANVPPTPPLVTGKSSAHQATKPDTTDDDSPVDF